MSLNRTVTLYLPDGIIDAAREGRHNFFNRVMAAVRGQGWQVELRPDVLRERLLAAAAPGYGLSLMEEPPAGHGLVCRHTYVGAFWHIERSAKRWEWPVATASFTPEAIDPETARIFAAHWRRRLFKGAADAPRRESFVFVPLQGMLQDHRSFQAMSPLDMLDVTLEQMPSARILATLHPKETYSAADLRALEALATRHPRLRVATGGAVEALAACDLVVTQNSGVAFNGYFFGKPAVLFAEIDFHHIAASVPRLGVVEAFRAAGDAAPDYDRYLWWFLADQSIAAGSPQAEAQILAALRRGGWPI
ncbi:MAG: hypothetical protein K0B00_01685 [Rhodobacteraceae bacterium]|nr:hypothetical protein [Paracoccaceae bacterium]